MAMTEPIVDVYLTPDDVERSLHQDARAGLTSSPRWLPPKWFYDSRGSDLFEEITRLPEYYPTRAERSILVAHAGDIARRTGAHTLVELGSGSSEKTRLLLSALQEAGTLRQYVPLDVSETALRGAVAAIHDDHQLLRIHGVVADFTLHLDRIPGQTPRVVAFLGGTIGNLFPDERATFLGELRTTLAPGDWLLLGTDLVKDPAVLVPAYDDIAGVTAEFNRNVLAVLNRELGANFDLANYEHVAVWDAGNEWVEMRLRATARARVRLPELDLDIELQSGEEIRTEISAKFRREGVESELAGARFSLDSWWTDRHGLFALTLAQAC
jgi:L-histidine N-alpha-methyltransferase